MDDIIYPCTRNEQGLSLYPVAECSHQALIDSPETLFRLLSKLHRQLEGAEPARLRPKPLILKGETRPHACCRELPCPARLRPSPQTITYPL
jgi:hypothetical protein